MLAAHLHIRVQLVWGKLSCPEVQVSDHGMVLPVQESTSTSVLRVIYKTGLIPRSDSRVEESGNEAQLTYGDITMEDMKALVAASASRPLGTMEEYLQSGTWAWGVRGWLVGRGGGGGASYITTWPHSLGVLSQPLSQRIQRLRRQ